jgi:hypothetical protein
MMRRALFGCVLGLFSLGTATTPLAATRPSLVVVIVVDQMRRDYVEDYGSHWTKACAGCSTRAPYAERRVSALTTLTCAGHATIATGTFPATHGIINNTWWDRETQKNVSCSSDATAVRSPTAIASLAVAAGTAAEGADFRRRARRLSAAWPHRHAVDEAGVRGDAGGPEGRRGPVAAGKRVEQLDGIRACAEKSLLRFIQANPVEADFGKSWSRMGKAATTMRRCGPGREAAAGVGPDLPASAAAARRQADDVLLRGVGGEPVSDAYVARMAGAAIDGMKLGQDRGPTTWRSASRPRRRGPRLRPRSHEIQDVLMRLDETLGKFLADLDKKVGKDRYVLAFTADHGVAEIPEQAKAEGKDAGRIMMDDIMARTDQTIPRSSARATGGGPGLQRALLPRARLREADRRSELLASVIHGIEAVPGVQRVIDGRTLAARPQPTRTPPRRRRERATFPAQRRPADHPEAELDLRLRRQDDHPRQRDDARHLQRLRPARAADPVRRRHRERPLRDARHAGRHRADARAPLRDQPAHRNRAPARRSAAASMKRPAHPRPVLSRGV